MSMKERPALTEKTKKREVSIPQERLQIASVTLAVAAIFLLASIVQSLLHSLILWNFPSLTTQSWYRWVIGSLPMYLVAMPFSLLIFRLGRSHAPEPREKMSGWVFLGLLAVCFGLTYAGQLFGNLINMIIGFFTGSVPENGLEAMTMDAPFWVNLVFVGLLAPVMEELFYRKLVIDRLRRYGDVIAIFVSGVLFGLIHGNFHQLFYAASIGCLFGYVYVRTGRIRYTVLLHVGINLVGGVYTTEMLKRLDAELFARDPLLALTQSPAGTIMYLAYMAFVLLSVIGAVLASVLLILRWKRAPEKGAVHLTLAEWGRAVLLNPGVYLLLLVVVMLFANNL